MKRVLWDSQFLPLLLIALLIGAVSWSISWVGVFVFGWGFGDATGNDAFISYLFMGAFFMALPASFLLWAVKRVQGTRSNAK